MPKSSLIVFVGPVGVGKSTHIKLLYLILKHMGLKIRTSILKTSHILAFILVIFLWKIAAGHRRDVLPIRALIEEKPQLFQKLLMLWLILDLVSITVKFIKNIYIPLKLGYTIIVEEYLLATISDYLYISKIVNFPLKFLSHPINYLLRLTSLSNPMYTIFLDAGMTELTFRWRLRGSLDEREDYIQSQRNILLRLSKIFSHNFYYINTEGKGYKECQKIIYSCILHHVIKG